MANIALLTAAGHGNRMGQDLPKQFLSVEDKPLIIYTCESFQNSPDVDGIVIVCIPGWEQVMEAYANQFNITKLIGICPGGETGHESIGYGLNYIAKKYSQNDLVLVHDGVRPLVSKEVIRDSIDVAHRKGNAVAITPINEALLTTSDQKTSSKIIDRDTTKKTQTPHTFPLGTLLDMHRKAKIQGITDTVASCTLAIELGMKVNFSRGSEKNFKVTTPEDIEIFKALLNAQKSNWMK